MLFHSAVQRLTRHGKRRIWAIENYINPESLCSSEHLGLLVDACIVNEGHDLTTSVLTGVPYGLEGAVEEIFEDDCILGSVEDLHRNHFFLRHGCCKA